MATNFDNTFGTTNAANNLRLWADFIFDTLIIAGWIQTSDTGQTAPAALVTPGGANTKVGYSIFRMNDSLQSTKPVFIRVDYGSGSAVNNPGIWFTIGTGSDGAGVITGVRFAAGASAPQIGWTGSATLCNAYGSGADGAWFNVGMIQGTSNLCAFGIERGKDSTGAEDGDLILFYQSASSGQFTRLNTLLWVGGSQPAQEPGIATVMSGLNPSTFAGDVGIGLCFPMVGYARPAGLGFVIVNVADLAAEGTAVVTIYGSNHSYKQLGTTQVLTNFSGGSMTNGRCAMRYE